MIQNKAIKMKSLVSLVPRARAIVAGGLGQATGGTEYNYRTGKYEKTKRRCTSKAQALVDDLVKLHGREPTAKILVFSEQNATLKDVAVLLEERGLKHRLLLSTTSAKKRGEAIEAFMTDPPTTVFLLGAKAGGVGITLTAATHIYIMEPLMNPALEQQAIGRSRRMGQTREVTVFRMYCEDTIEERVREFVSDRHGIHDHSRSTAMAANAGATEFKVGIQDMHALLKHNHGDYSDVESDNESLGDSF